MAKPARAPLALVPLEPLANAALQPLNEGQALQALIPKGSCPAAPHKAGLTSKPNAASESPPVGGNKFVSREALDQGMARVVGQRV